MQTVLGCVDRAETISDRFRRRWDVCFLERVRALRELGEITRARAGCYDTRVKMIIDCHVHLLPAKVRRNRSLFCERDEAFGEVYCSEKAKLVSEEEIIAYLDRSLIDKAVVFGFPWEDEDLVRENNDEVWAFHQRFPHRIIPFAVLSAGKRDAALHESARTLNGGFAGLGELAMYHGGWNLDDFEALSPSLQLAQMKNVPVLIHINEPVGHTYPGKIAVDFNGLLRIIHLHPEVNFILAHFGGGIFIYALMPEVREIFARTYLDTAACPFLYDPRIFEVACRIMGPDKILFGSDYPLLPLSRYLKEMDKAGLDGDLREGILGINALHLFEGKP